MSEMIVPKYAWIASVRNKEAWIGETIKSLLDQEVQEFEAIFVDDESTDSTPLVLAHYVKKDPRFKVVTLKENMGVGYALNRATEQVTAPIILVASGDDVYSKQRSKITLDWFTEHPETDVYYGDFVLTDGALNALALKTVVAFDLEEYKKILPNGRANQTVPHGFCGYRTKVGQTVPYVEDRKVGNDYPFFLHVAEAGFKFSHDNCQERLGRNMGFYRLLPNSVTVQHAKEIQERDRELAHSR